MSHGRWHLAMIGMAERPSGLRSDDVMFCALPMYHNNALTVARVWCSPRARAWPSARSSPRRGSGTRSSKPTPPRSVTSVKLCRYLLAQPPKPVDRAHRVRLAVGNGLRPEIWDEFQSRFGIDRIVEFYSERVQHQLRQHLRAAQHRRVLPSCARLSRSTSRPASPSATREAGVGGCQGESRACCSGHLGADAAGRLHRPEATEEDRARRLPSRRRLLQHRRPVYSRGFGHIAFADRLGDTFRWKGENVATTEVEAVLNDVPGIVESVVYGVEVPGTDGRAGMARSSSTASRTGPGSRIGSRRSCRDMRCRSSCASRRRSRRRPHSRATRRAARRGYSDVGDDEPACSTATADTPVLPGVRGRTGRRAA